MMTHGAMGIVQLTVSSYLEKEHVGQYLKHLDYYLPHPNHFESGSK